METESMQECDARMRKARFWIRQGRRAMLVFGALFGVIIVTLILTKVLLIFGISIPTDLFDEIIFAAISLLMVSSLVILACNFLRNLYQKGSPCDACNPLQTHCSECSFQKPVNLEKKKDG